MNFRTKLLVVSTLTVLAATGLATWGVTRYAQHEFAEFDRQRSDALVAQFQRGFALRGDEVVNRVQGIADAEGTLRMALDLSRPQADFSLYASDASGLAATHGLDLLELAAGDDSVISSLQRPGAIGDKDDWLAAERNWNQGGAFLQRVELPDSAELGVVAVRSVHVGARDLYIAGGFRMDREFLGTVVPPPGMRVLLYANLQTAFTPAALISAEGSVPQAERFAALIASAEGQRHTDEEVIRWSADPASAERFVALPLAGRNDEQLGVLLVGSDQGEYASMVTRIRAAAAVVAAAGILLGIFLSWWVSARVTRPLARLADGAREVAGGNWNTQVKAHSRDEAGQAVRAFNMMTRHLAEQRGEALQIERVTAWREIALRLAHEVKERLFPLQVAAENFRRCREQGGERFDETFFESLATLTAELEKLKSTVATFGNFAKMPAPHLESLRVNDALRAAVKALEPQFSPIGHPPVTPELFLDDGAGTIAADPHLLGKALESILVRSLDSMPTGGTLTVRSGQRHGLVQIEIRDSGTGLTPEERTRLFTPYYAVSRQSAGLGLATAQSVVSDHGGRITVESAPGTGTTFRIQFFATKQDVRSAAPKAPDPKPQPAQTQELEPETAASSRSV